MPRKSPTATQPKLDAESFLRSINIQYDLESPERIYLATIDLRPDWTQWKESEPVTLLEPDMEYEGADMPTEPSSRGAVMEKVRQLRDPGIYQEGDATYLLYSVAGEQGIALARLLED